jgi:hypothetical protein
VRSSGHVAPGRDLLSRNRLRSLGRRPNVVICSMWPLGRSLIGSSVLVAMLAAALGVAGCSTTPPGSTYCLPEPLHVTPPQVAAGSSVTIASAPFKCGGTYPAGKKYQLTLGLVGRQPAVDLGSYPVNTDGSFAATVPIPADASPGEAGIIVHGSPFDQCGDSGQGSCAGYVVSLTIIPTIQ